MRDATPSDPARFARAIRGLAREAHRTLRRPPSPAALCGISRRIDALTSALGDRRGGPLGAWLENLGRQLGRQVRAAAADRAGASRPGCLCA